jgi:hypothetical protein
VWDSKGGILNMKIKTIASISVLVLCIFSSGSILPLAYGETIDKAILRSSVVIGSVDIPDTLVGGETYTIRWMAQAYVPIKSKFSIKYADNTKDFVNGIKTGEAEGRFSISGRNSREYYFEATYTVKTGKIGDASIGFHNAQDDGGDELWMYGIFPTGVIERPVGTAGKQFNVSITKDKITTIQGCTEDDNSNSACFEGFKENTIWTNWKMKRDISINSCIVSGPGNNNFCGDLVSHSQSLGEVHLEAKVENGVRKASEISTKRKFPTSGTFAARVKFYGDTSKGYYNSVKAFFTYAVNSNDVCSHMEHDFEVFTEEEHLWLVDKSMSTPVLTTVTHEREYAQKPPKDCQNDLTKEKPLTSEKKILSNKYLTLIVSVEAIPSSDALNNFTSRYYIVDSTNDVKYLGKTNTQHRRDVNKLYAMFNIWWLEPPKLDWLLPEGLDLGNPQQYMDIQWFYYLPEIVSSEPEALNVHAKGMYFDEN